MRLIDADALMKKLNNTTVFIKDGTTFQRMIADAPTISGWIPVSERLPKKHGPYLCTIQNCLDEDMIDVEVLTYGKPTLPMNEGRGVGWYYFGSEGDYYWSGITAWMPLPEPWKGGE